MVATDLGETLPYSLLYSSQNDSSKHPHIPNPKVPYHKVGTFPDRDATLDIIINTDHVRGTA